MRKTAVVATTRVLAAITAFGLQVLLTRELSSKEYGIYAVTTAWLWLLSGIGKGGLEPTVIKHITLYGRIDPSPEMLARFRRFITSRVLLVSFCVSAAWLPYGLLMHSPGLAILTAMAVPILASLRIAAAELRGADELILAASANNVLFPLGLMLLVPALIRTDIGSATATTVALAVLVSSSVVLAVTKTRFRKLHLFVKDFGAKTLPSTRKQSWTSGTGWLMAYGVMGLVLGQSDIILVGLIAGEQDAGQYNVAWQIASLLSLPLVAANMVLAPSIAKYAILERVSSAQKALRRATWLCFLVSASALVVLVFAGEALLGVFGREFQNARSVLLVLAAGQVANAFGGPVANTLLYNGKNRTVAVALTISAAFNAVGSLLLGYWLGPEGVAVGTAASLSGYNLALNLISRRQLGICPAPLPTSRRTRRLPTKPPSEGPAP